MSEYFKNAFNLSSNLALETPDCASKLKSFTGKHVEGLNDKLNHEGFPPEESVYLDIGDSWYHFFKKSFLEHSNHICPET